MQAAGLTLYDEDTTSFALATSLLADGQGTAWCSSGLRYLRCHFTERHLKRGHRPRLLVMLRQKGESGTKDGQVGRQLCATGSGMTVTVWRDGARRRRLRSYPCRSNRYKTPIVNMGTPGGAHCRADGAKNVTTR